MPEAQMATGTSHLACWKAGTAQNSRRFPSRVAFSEN
jgi:hypothetical protein